MLKFIVIIRSRQNAVDYEPQFFFFLILVAVHIKKYVWVTIIFFFFDVYDCCFIWVEGGLSSEVTLSGFRDSYSNPTELKQHLVNASTDIKGTQTWIVLFLFFRSTFDIWHFNCHYSTTICSFRCKFGKRQATLSRLVALLLSAVQLLKAL